MVFSTGPIIRLSFGAIIESADILTEVASEVDVMSRREIRPDTESKNASSVQLPRANSVNKRMVFAEAALNAFPFCATTSLNPP